MKRKRVIVLVLAVCFSFLLLSCQEQEALLIEQPSEAEETVSGGASENEDEPKNTESENIWVDVGGAVKNPGVYSLKAGSRVFEAVNAAGGFLEEADRTEINQAAVLTDGEKIRIYTGEELQEMAAAGLAPESETQSGKINLNTASLEELQQIPGIGAVRAQAILDYREKSGDFRQIEDVQGVDGIKGKTFEKIEEYITVK